MVENIFFVCGIVLLSIISMDPNKSEGVSTSIQDHELQALSSELMKIDSNKVSVKYNLQGKQNYNQKRPVDMAPQPLFDRLSDEILKRDTYSKFLSLLDNYERRVETPEDDTEQEKQEIDEFLNSITQTQVMQKVKNFLIDKGKISKKTSFRDVLAKIWFGGYSRDKNRVEGSSGFEHVFVGEIKNRAISGLHNWLQYYLLEVNGNINYEGYFAVLHLEAPVTFLKYKFSWDQFTKPTSSMFIGTSPELEMALYTLCFYARPNQKCPVKFGTKSIYLHVYSMKRGNDFLIGSAYPSLS